MKISLFAGALAVALITTGCNNDDDNPTPSGGPGGGGGGTTPLTATTPCSLNMTINGSVVSYVSADLGPWTCLQGGGGGGVFPGVLVERSWAAGVSNLDSDVGFSGLEFRVGSFQYMNGGPVSDNQFFSYFAEGVLPFGTVDQELNKVEVVVWEDGARFSSACGTGNQTGSQVQIIDLLPITSQFFTGEMKARITFNCKLYPCDGIGSTKTITGGTAVVSFGNI